MSKPMYTLESNKLFSESLIWQLNRDYYQTEGIEAWRSGTVPHQVSSSSFVGKTYAELVFAFLRDLANKGQTQETVYILELGAGHGRLAFHFLKHLGQLTAQLPIKLPSYCYILSDIGEDNLDFFHKHPQFKTYYESGLLDLAFFDGIHSKEIALRHSGKKISANNLKQALVVLANYFFDSIPSDLFHMKDQQLFSCSLSLQTSNDPQQMSTADLLDQMKLIYHDSPMPFPFYETDYLNKILAPYQDLASDTYLLFPHKGLQCLDNLKQLSTKGLVLISMDKGYHKLHDLENTKAPEMITHGSMSFWVNYHAFDLYCQAQGGSSLLPSYSNISVELNCLLLLPESESYTETHIAYKCFVNNFGPDDFNVLKNFAYKQIAHMTLLELLALLRLSAYDSTMFINVLPRLKQITHRISFNDRARLAETMHKTWETYFTLKETEDLAYEIGGMFYALLPRSFELFSIFY